MTVTGNELRDKMIADAILDVQLNGDPVTLPVLQMKLPADFDLTQDEADAILAAMSIPVDPEPQPEPEAGPEAEPIMPMADVQASIVLLHSELSAERGNYLTLQTKQRAARDTLAKAVQSFVSGFVPVTPEQNIRAHLAAEQERRAAIARGELNPHANESQPGPSLVDRMAFGHGGRHGTRAASWRRGAFAAHNRGRVVPSER